MGNLILFGSDDMEYGKAIQIYLRNVPYLAVGSTGYKHHDILLKFLIDNQIAFKEKRLIGPDFGPEPIGQDYKLVGAGMAIFHADKIRLIGQSGGYRIKPDETHAREISGLIGRFVKVER